MGLVRDFVRAVEDIAKSVEIIADTYGRDLAATELDREFGRHQSERATRGIEQAQAAQTRVAAAQEEMVQSQARANDAQADYYRFLVANLQDRPTKLDPINPEEA